MRSKLLTSRDAAVGIFIGGVLLILTWIEGDYRTSTTIADEATPLNASSFVATPSQDASSPLPRVETVRPNQGGLARLTSQPGSAHSFESAELYSKVSGFLKNLAVDIGSMVKEGDLLAEIDVPELVEDVSAAVASLEQAKAEVLQAEAQVESAIADERASVAKIEQAQAERVRSIAEVAFSDKQLARTRELNQLRAIEDRIVDEKVYQLESAKSTQLAAESSVVASRQIAKATASRIALAKAQLDVQRAKVAVAESQLNRAKVMLSYTRIVSPYDGVITVRNFHRGAFVRSPDQGGNTPLLVVDRTDKMRVVVRIPERHVPFIHPGDLAILHFDAFPRKEFRAPVARISATEDPATRSMLAEIDMPNPDGMIRDHMFGRVEIALEEPLQGLTIPSSCLVGDVKEGKAKLMVVKENKIDSKEIQVGRDTGLEVEVLSGLQESDVVVVQPPSGLKEGDAVAATPYSPSAPSTK